MKLKREKVMKRKVKLDNPMLIDLIVGNIIFLILGEIILFIIFTFIGLRWDLALGYLIGVIVSIGMVIHMAYSIDDSVRMDEHTALKHIRKTYIFRIIAAIIIFAVIWFLEICNIGAVLLGMLVLKFSAYITPITHRLTSKILRKGR